MKNNPRICSIAGIMSILFWSSTIGISRKVTEDIGAIRSGFYIFLTGGILGFIYNYILRKKLRELLALKKSYILICGGLFVLYMVCFYLAVGLAKSRQAAIEVGIINYFWPALTLLFSAPILKTRLKPIIIPGIIIAIAGIVLATSRGEISSFASISDRITHNAVAYILAFTAAISWALYSNLSRLLSPDSDVEASALFMVFSAVIFYILNLYFDEPEVWTTATYINIVYLIIFPTILAYQFWEMAMTKGDMLLVAEVSYLTPVISTIASCIILSVFPDMSLWTGASLVIAGALLSRKGVEIKKEA